jgi:shikimate dehydrogenase
LDHVTDEAATVGAVNVIKIMRSSPAVGPVLKGYNTDIIGFDLSLSRLIGDKKVAALVLGTGGASKAVCFVLRNRGISYIQVSRISSGSSIAYQQMDASIMQSHHLIINTTPLGMAPHVNEKPEIPYSLLTTDHFLFDVIYNPEETAFLRSGRLQGSTVMNGLYMLEQQALASWDIWTRATE